MPLVARCALMSLGVRSHRDDSEDAVAGFGVGGTGCGTAAA